MIDFLSSLRLKNIYDPNRWDVNSGVNADTEPTPLPMPIRRNITDLPTRDMMFRPPPLQLNQPPEQDPEMDIQALMGQLYTPETEASDRFNEMINNRPQPNQNAGFLRKLAAVLAGTASNLWGSGNGQQVFENVISPGYRRQLEDWDKTIGPAQQAANLERGNNANERSMAYQTIQGMLNDRRTNETARRNAETERLAREREEKRLADAERIRLEQEGRSNLAGQNATAAMERVIAQQAGAMERMMQGGQNQLAAIDAREAAKNAQVKQGEEGFLNQEAREAISLINELYDADKDSLSDAARKGVGKDFFRGWIPATEAYNVHAKIKSLKDKLTLSIIQAMKQQSKTGATGFGQLNLRELGVLESAASILDPKLGEEEFKKELKKIKERLEKVLLPATSKETTTTKKPFDPAAYFAEAMAKLQKGGK